jgi:hypothetical protein
MAIQEPLWCSSQRTLGGSSNNQVIRCRSVGSIYKGIGIWVSISIWWFLPAWLLEPLLVLLCVIMWNCEGL